MPAHGARRILLEAGCLDFNTSGGGWDLLEIILLLFVLVGRLRRHLLNGNQSCLAFFFGRTLVCNLVESQKLHDFFLVARWFGCNNRSFVLIHGCLASLMANLNFVSADFGHILILRKYFLRCR